MSGLLAGVEEQREVAPPDPGGVPRFELPTWRARHGLVAGITARGDEGEEFDLNLSGTGSVASVIERWRTVQRSVAGSFGGIVASRQVHGAAISEDCGAPGIVLLDGFDGHLTQHPATLLAVTVADCVPVYLAAPRQGVIMLLHAGWRGAVAKIVEHGVSRLAAVAGCGPGQLIMHLGVGICGACYEVGPDILERLGQPSAGKPALVDLRGVLAQQGRDAGVQQITTSPWCTFHHPGEFYSHRRDPERSGRMVAYLGRPPA